MPGQCEKDGIRNCTSANQDGAIVVANDNNLEEWHFLIDELEERVNKQDQGWWNRVPDKVQGVGGGNPATGHNAYACNLCSKAIGDWP